MIMSFGRGGVFGARIMPWGHNGAFRNGEIQGQESPQHEVHPKLGRKAPTEPV
eukprot:CAMPEP_0113710834 /NCGR_PEP_ID=MMETSP0038_2-20120614/30393_1 /TAXON_ID=2898 /ORGANISM="Cryptomonas paramecium" /LENGTH=52 /DNA_ID=CAMNT_0000636967 /DNA_START=18 /DNA_END=177 /DNA_ORIENTATION=- /assembly_acc=CAM_ASM_000170